MKKIIISLIATPAFMPLFVISCGEPKYYNPPSIDYGKYFSNTKYEYVANEYGWPIQAAKNLGYFSNPNIDWGPLKMYQEEVLEPYDPNDPSSVPLLERHQLLTTQVQDRETNIKYQWFGVYDLPWNNKTVYEAFIKINHFWWEYLDLFKNETGYYPMSGYGEENYSQEFLTNHPSNVQVYIDDNEAFVNFMTYDYGRDKMYSFIANLSANELTLRDEMAENEGDVTKLINYEWYKTVEWYKPKV